MRYLLPILLMVSNLSGVTIWSSFSMRTPNIEPNPFDYEVKFGVEDKSLLYQYQAGVLFERENGGEYWGTDGRGRVTQEVLKVRYDLDGKWYYRQAKDINTMSFRVGKQLFPYVWTGTGVNWIDNVPQITQSFLVGGSWLFFEYETNAIDRNITHINVGKEFWFGPYGVAPLFRYDGIDGKDAWQFKTTLKVKL